MSSHDTRHTVLLAIWHRWTRSALPQPDRPVLDEHRPNSWSYIRSKEKWKTQKKMESQHIEEWTWLDINLTAEKAETYTAAKYVCVHSYTKTTGHITTNLGRWIVGLHDKSWSPISFQVKSLNVTVTWSNRPKCNAQTAPASHEHSPKAAAVNVILQLHNIYIYLRSKRQMPILAWVCTLLSASPLVDRGGCWVMLLPEHWFSY